MDNKKCGKFQSFYLFFLGIKDEDRNFTSEAFEDLCLQALADV